MDNKKPRFFCEHCNAEVNRDAKFCKKCGHFFASVKCPACGKIGTADKFKNGCPVCGYAVGATSHNLNKNTQFQNKKNSPVIGNKKNFTLNKKKAAKSNEEGLPLWIYLVTVGIFAALLVFIFSY